MNIGKNTTTYFSPSIYKFMWTKVADERNTSNQYCFNSFYLPDTILIEHSEIVDWYFSGINDPAILKKNKTMLTIENILESFTKHCYTLQCCCSIIFMDLNKNSDIVHKIFYLTPPQLRYILIQLKQVELNCIIQKNLVKMPDLKQLPTVQQLYDDMNKIDVRKVVSNARQKLIAARQQLPEMQQFGQRYKQYGHNNQLSIQDQYAVIHAKWRPDQLILQARRSRHQLNLFRNDVNDRYATFFQGHLDSDQFALSKNQTAIINQCFGKLAVHISFVSGKKVQQIEAYVQHLETAENRKDVFGKTPVFLFATSLVLDNVEYDGNWSQALQFSIRKLFKPPVLLPYNVCRQVVLAFSSTNQIASGDQIYKIIYRIALTSTFYNIPDTIRSNREKLLLLFNMISQDLQAKEQELRRTAYMFFEQIIERLIYDEEYQQVIKELQLNDRQKYLCSRCEKVCATFTVPLKFLLIEPLYYFKNKVPQLTTGYKTMSLGDCYSLLRVVIFSDQKSLKYRDTLRIHLQKAQKLENPATEFEQKEKLRCETLATEVSLDLLIQQSLKQENEKESETAAVLQQPEDLDLANDYNIVLPFSQEEDNLAHTGYMKQLLENRFLGESLKETKEFHAIIQKLVGELRNNRLDIANLNLFFDVVGRQIDSIVPNKLLRKAGLIQSKMDPDVFLHRIDERSFIYRGVWLCNCCYAQVVDSIQKLNGMSQQFERLNQQNGGSQ